MKVQHKKTGRVAEVLSQNEKLVKVHFIKEDVDQDMTVSTFKRWWKQVEDEDVAGDGTPLAEVGKEIAEQAKQKAEAAKKEDPMEEHVQEVEVKEVKTVKKSVKKTAEKKEKKPREKFDVTGKIVEIKTLIKDTEFSVTGQFDKKGIVLKHNSVKGLTIRIYIATQKMIFELTDNQHLEGVTPDRVRKLRYSKAYDISYSESAKLVEYLNKVTYNKPTKSKKEGK